MRSFFLDDASAALAERLRRVTVRLTGRGWNGAGSGVVWRHDGLIVTNAHVARGPTMTVSLHDGRELTGRVAWRSRSMDLAALHVDARDLLAAGTADAGSLRTGALVFAMGAPLGMTDALATGVVHGAPTLDRAGRPLLVRADIRLLPGNSGGPLVDAAGRVIGINSMVVNGLGVAVATEAVEGWLQRLAHARAA
jgi:serine protease Do